MTVTDAIEICREAIMAMIFISAPILVIMLVVGVIISLFQALTQIQEQTLTFVPKMLIGFAATIFCYLGVNLFLSGLHSYGK